ncbi:DNA-directed RNA polymerase subunit omega [Pullulanibacillus sp. KACC 23026]|uniref:DNA-directed RNA polymerase subunit omega n=1 Tax=Pullulanibacillus sp. KACC 23026 TaxID=3028315 RepID=UPI0023B0A3E9|nr:DNA-directed RNA polymerase subunit omega [Pullulanibacillus sp. KACC 23026]WEG15001.1 DNA-directed RNA polymerase subunit omega [Pullulanibacillus sp. KACC 23026]
MLYPSIDSLLEKVNSKYTLVTLSSKRARQIQQEGDVLIPRPFSDKPVGKALEEIREEAITIKHS